MRVARNSTAAKKAPKEITEECSSALFALDDFLRHFADSGMGFLTFRKIVVPYAAQVRDACFRVDEALDSSSPGVAHWFVEAGAMMGAVETLLALQPIETGGSDQELEAFARCIWSTVTKANDYINAGRNGIGAGDCCIEFEAEYNAPKQKAARHAE